METIEAQIINGNKYGPFLMIYIVLGWFLTVFIGINIFKNFYIAFGGLIMISLAPFIFEKNFQKRFVNNANFSFSKDNITIQVFERLTNALEKQYDASYNKIASFKVKDSSRDTTTSFLTLIMKDGQKYSFRIINQKEIQISNFVTNNVLTHNRSVSKENQILLIPNFLATNAGFITVVILSILKN